MILILWSLADSSPESVPSKTIDLDININSNSLNLIGVRS